MKKIAYIFTKQHTGELMEDSLLLPIALGQHGAEVIAIYFIEDGVYHLVKGGRSSKNLKIAMSEQNVKIFACDISIKNRNLQNIIIDGVHKGDFKDFYEIVLGVDHIVSF